MVQVDEAYPLHNMHLVAVTQMVCTTSLTEEQRIGAYVDGVDHECVSVPLTRGVPGQRGRIFSRIWMRPAIQIDAPRLTGKFLEPVDLLVILQNLVGVWPGGEGGHAV